jgi:hypothetical protein
VIHVTFGPPRARALSLLGGVAACVAAAFFIPEFGALAAVLLFFAVRDLWFPVVLVLEDDGFGYVAGVHHEYAEWLSVDDVRVREERHWLAFGKTLEIDLIDDTLIVLSSAQLGVDADKVASLVDARWREALRRSASAS